MANKNSIYVQSLVDFILDTKPYHSKLTEIVEEYRFSDEMTVHFDERFAANMITKAAWLYSYFSNGVSSPAPTMGLHQVVNPQFRVHTKNSQPLANRGAFKVGRDEVTDLPLVPLTFDPKSIQGVGISDAFVQRGGLSSMSEPLLEGHDFYQSHGAYVFSINQAKTVPGNQYAPLFTERPKSGLLSHVTGTVQAQALMTGNPTSAISQVQALVDQIAAQLVLTPDAAASAELAAIQATLDTVALPNSYEGLLNALTNASIPVLAGFAGWIGQDTTAPYTDEYVNQRFAELSPGPYFNLYTDLQLRENGALGYDAPDSTSLTMTNIVADSTRVDYEEFTLVAITPTSFAVSGSVSGFIGPAFVPGNFTSGPINFTLAAGVDPIVVGDTYTLTPRATITIHENAPLESWSLIKVNPRAYTRPIFSSTRYGYIIDATAVKDFVTVLDTGFPTSTITLTATSATTFTLTSSAEPLYTATVTVNTPFNDGRLAFTIIPGSAYAFHAGDRFYIEIVNQPPVAEDLDLYYGFDVGPYDAENLVYDNVNTLVADYLRTLDFGWDSRFTSYDFASFGLNIAPAAVDGRQWRLRAISNGTDLVLGNYAPSGQVSLIATDDPTNPNAPTQFDSVDDVSSEGPQSATDPDLATDLRLFYADSFDLEYYDIGSDTWIFVANVPVGSSYSDVTHGLSFTIVPGTKPFIASTLHSSWYQTPAGPFVEESVQGGDVIAWTVRNEPPFQDGPSGLTSGRVPRLIIHGDSYHQLTPATWTLTFTGPGVYTLEGVYATGPNAGSPLVFPYPSIDTAVEGQSHLDTTWGVHYSVVNGLAGLDAGDSFTFTTFEEKPSYLVHGSVSGWQPDATVGKWYWNGKIGFKLALPVVKCFEGGFLLPGSPWTTGIGVASLNGVRFDCPNALYEAKAQVNGHWMLYRNGRIVGEGATTVADEYLSVTLPTAVAGASLTFSVEADERALAMGQDLAIIRTSPGRTPTTNDFVLVERTEADTIQISVKPKDSAHAVVLQDLAPVTVDLRYVDHTTNLGGVSLETTSPETSVLQGWIPALFTHLDSATSTADFRDPATILVARAAATGETIGTVKSIGSTPAEPVLFTWDSAFANKYLPLNAEATVVTLGSGMNDLVNVTMTDEVLLLLSGGGLAENSLFNDTINVAIIEDNQWTINASYASTVDALIADGPFGGFLPGFDNLPFDFEVGGDVNTDSDEGGPNPGNTGYYDAGQGLVDYFSQAQQLAAIALPTPQEQALLNDLLALIDPYLDGDLASTTLAEFVAALNADNPINYTPGNQFGVPAVGMGLDIASKPEGSTAASVQDAFVIVSNDLGYTYDLHEYDLGPLDEPSDTTAILFSSSLPPVPNPPPVITTYAALETPLEVPAPGARNIELSFAADIGIVTPPIYVWRPTDAAPIQVMSVERVGTRVLRFSLPAASEVKVIVG